MRGGWASQSFAPSSEGLTGAVVDSGRDRPRDRQRRERRAQAGRYNRRARAGLQRAAAQFRARDQPRALIQTRSSMDTCVWAAGVQS